MTAPETHPTPRILIIDNADVDNRWLDLLAAYTPRHLRSVAELDAYLEDEAAGNPPMAALVDVDLGVNSYGLHAVHRLQKSAVTARTVPVLFSSTMGKEGRLKENNMVGDLHSIFCAEACLGAGILLCSKEEDLQIFAKALPDILRRWNHDNVDVTRLVGAEHGDLRFVKPIRDVTHGPAKSLVRSLLGNDWKQLFWDYVADDKSNPRNALHTMLSDFKRADVKPAYTLDGDGDWEGEPDPSPLRRFVSGDIGHVAYAWFRADQDFLHRTITTYGTLSRPLEKPGSEARSAAFTVFAAKYARFLSNLDTKEFANWYMTEGPGKLDVVPRRRSGGS